MWNWGFRVHYQSRRQLSLQDAPKEGAALSAQIPDCLVNAELSADGGRSLGAAAQEHGAVALSLQFIDGLNSFLAKLVRDCQRSQDGRISPYVNQLFSRLRVVQQRTIAVTKLLEAHEKPWGGTSPPGMQPTGIRSRNIRELPETPIRLTGGLASASSTRVRRPELTMRT